MSSLTVRTKDEELLKALRCWWEEFSPGLPEGKWILTDGDSEKVLGKENEIVFRKRPERDSLSVPFPLRSWRDFSAKAGSLPLRRGKERTDRANG